MKYRYISGIALFLLAFFKVPEAFSQAPSISYNSPQTYFYNTAASALTPLNNGGIAAVNGQTSTFAGNGVVASLDGIGTGASFNGPLGIAVGTSGNIFVADAGGNVIRMMTPQGGVITVAGNGTAGATNGVGTAASFSHPDGICTDASGNIYVADLGNHLIRKISPAGLVTTLAGSGSSGFVNGTGTAASFSSPTGVAVDAAGNVYVADNGNNSVRKISPQGVVSTFAGNGAAAYVNGTGTAASFHGLFGITIDASGNLYVADRGNHAIRKISPASIVTTLAGSGNAVSVNGTGTGAGFTDPASLTVDVAGNVYVTELGASSSFIRRITPAGVVTTLAGIGPAGWKDGIGNQATFANPWAISADPSGSLYVSDFSNNLIRRVAYTAFTISPQLPQGMTFNSNTGVIAGTPTILSPATIYIVNAYNGFGKSADAQVNITVKIPGDLNLNAERNYIISSTPRTSGLYNDDLLHFAVPDRNKAETSIQYIDGLGRLSQTIQVKGSPTGRDIVQPVAYDQFGREAVKYLPYTAPAVVSDGSYKGNAITDQSSFYINPALWSAQGVVQMQSVGGTAPAFSTTIFESSPLNRVIEQGAPGLDWQPVINSTAGHTVKTVYTTNNITALADTALTRLVARYTVSPNADQSRTLSRESGQSSNYETGSLDVTVTKDENWKSGRGGTTEEYKDKDGHLVLKRTFNYVPGASAELQILSTYYVYDDFGNLSFVLPPKSNADNLKPDQSVQDNLCYQYRYDERNRLTEKKIPGKGWEFMVYNSLDQVAFTQDANQRSKTNQEWTFIRYDVMGRVAKTGIYQAGVGADGNLSNPSRSTKQFLAGFAKDLMPAWTTRDNSTGSGYTTDNPQGQFLTINYYDDYSFSGIPYAPTVSGVIGNPKGLLTANQTVVLNPDGTYGIMLWAVHYYDDRGREVQTYQQHNLGGAALQNTNNYDVTETTYNFDNQVATTTRHHNTAVGTVPLKVSYRNEYFYDHMGRRLENWQQIQNAGQAPDTRTLLSRTDYNEIGQLLTKKLHSPDGANFLQTITYTYNERGWQQSSGAPLFAEQLYYNTGTNKQYNGNIAYQSWGKAGNLNNSYTYGYDQLNRLNLGAATTGNNETGIVYDLNGNIGALNRFSGGNLIDELSYTYAAGSNRLQSVTDVSGQDLGQKNGTASYTYDGNGNLTADNSKGITQISYNLLNLPMTITGKGTMYTYDASGQKLRRVMPGGATTDYISGIQYEGTGIQQPAIAFIQTEEGRALPNGAQAYNYEYSLTDHLGNSRVNFDSATGVARLVQTDDYYPFGMDIIPPGTVRVSPQNNYLYNKKELQDGLNWYDYGARFYDPVIARFISVDPLATKYPWYTPYQFAGNEVPNAIDRDGLEPAYLKPDGTYTLARDGQLNRPLVGADANVSSVFQHSRTQIGAANKVPGIIQEAAGLATGILGPINTLITGENPDGTKANALDYAIAPLMILTSLPMEGGENPGINELGNIRQIGPAGDPGAIVTRQIPSDYIMTTSKNGEGTIFKDPQNPSGNNVRVQSGNPNSPNPAQQNPYVKQTSNGKVVDANGAQVNPKSPEAHIPIFDFKSIKP